jgi:hypothetical protein
MAKAAVASARSARLIAIQVVAAVHRMMVRA